MIPTDYPKCTNMIIIAKSIDKASPREYFDGSFPQDGSTGSAILYLNEEHHFKTKMGLGRGTNNYVELINIIQLLSFSLENGCKHLEIFGDSKLIIKCINKKYLCHMD